MQVLCTFVFIKNSTSAHFTDEEIQAQRSCNLMKVIQAVNDGVWVIPRAVPCIQWCLLVLLLFLTFFLMS